MPCLTVTVRPGAVMPEDTGWAVVPLPEHMSSVNAEQVSKRLLSAIDRGAAVLVADLTATSSCDSSGAGALLDAYQRGVAAGTELRLVVTAEAVRRALRLGGLAHLALMFPTPAAALAELQEGRHHPGQALKIAAMPLDAARAGEPETASEADNTLLDSAVGRIFEVALSLQDADGLTPERIAEALGKLDDAIGDIRGYVFAENGRACQAGTGGGYRPDIPARAARNAQHSVALRR